MKKIAALFILFLFSSCGQAVYDIVKPDGTVNPVHINEIWAFSDGLAPVRVGNRFGYINKNGSFQIPAIYDGIASFSEERAAVLLGDSAGYIDTNGRMIIKDNFEECHGFSEGRARVKKNDAYAFITPQGQFVTGYAFFYATDFHEGLAAVGFYDRTKALFRYAYINKQGRVRFYLNTTNHNLLPYPFHNGIAKVKSDGHVFFILTNGHKLFSSRFTGVSYFSKGFAAVSHGTLWGYIDTNDNKITPEIFAYAGPFGNASAIVKDTNENYGLIGKDGRFLFKPVLDKLYDFSEGLALFRYGQKYGYLSPWGHIVIKPSYDDALGFSEGLAAVQDKQWGFINHNGKILIPMKFDNADSFIDGLAPAKLHGRWGLIDKTGRWVITPRFPVLRRLSKTLFLIKK